LAGSQIAVLTHNYIVSRSIIEVPMRRRRGPEKPPISALPANRRGKRRSEEAA
jgi:hypothetical protein